MTIKLCMAGALLASMAIAQTAKHVPTFKESLEMQSPSSPAISPDGQWVVYSVRTTDWEQNAYVSQLWLASSDGARRFQLTRGAKSASSPQWSPDGRWIAFLAERPADTPAPKAEDKPAPRQIWVIAPQGGEAWELTQHLTDVAAFHWSPDGKRIAFTAPAPESAASKRRTKEYSDYTVFEHDFTENQLLTVPVMPTHVGASTTVVGQRDLNVEGFDWAPDSQRIVFAATPDPMLADGSGSDIYLAETAAVKKIVALAGPDTNPKFSPDGTEIVFQTALAQPENFYANGHLATVKLADVLAKPATQPGDVTDLTAAFDEDPGLIGWTPSGIYYGASQKTTSQIYRLTPGSAPTRLTPEGTYRASGATFTPDGKYFAYLDADPKRMSEVAVSGSARFNPRFITDFNAALDQYTLGTAEVINWKSSDGATIEGILHKPADFQPGRKYPLFVVIHGGPTGVSTAAMSPADTYYPIQRFLARGALVLEPNYRGSAGYGAKFRALNVRNLGVGDMWDVMSGVDSLIAKGLVDPTRMGAMGWSEGGYISAFLTTHTDRFKAISVGAGISDWMTYYVSTDITPFTRQYLLSTPWTDPAIYAKTSPISTITQAKTPTLIQQGSEDKRVPVPDSFELYRGLQDMHVPSRLILYTGYGHPITKPKSNRAVLEANWDWFAHYIWGDPFPKDSALYGTSELGGGQ
ncbi:MAG TPA: S9 family peptidase [Terriglobales bacterium]|nr:S9 family peptidase [Terriglobales bacterium]